jgi:UDP-glucose 4-epimerase
VALLTESTPERVLVTGGSGMLGSTLVDLLIENGVREVVVFDRTVNRGNLASALSSGRVRLIEADIRDPSSVDRAVAGCDVVVHLAAMLMRASRQDPREAFDVNTGGTHSVLWAASQHRVKRFVLGSSVGVYGTPGPEHLITEDSPIGARTFYGASKFACELYCRCFTESFALPFIALRIGTLYGARLHPSGFYPGQLLRLLELRDSPRLAVEGDPNELHDFLYVSDAAEAIFRAVLSEVSDVAVNVVSGKPVTWEEIVKELLAAARSSAELEWQARSGDKFAFSRRFSGKLAHDLLDFRPNVSLSQGMLKLVDWFQNRPRAENVSIGAESIAGVGASKP